MESTRRRDGLHTGRGAASPTSSLSTPPEDLSTNFDLDNPVEDAGASDTDTEDSDAAVTDRPAPPIRRGRLPARRRRLQRIVNTLRQEGWSLSQFLAAWVDTDIDGGGFTINHFRYGRVEGRRQALLDACRDNPQLRGLLIPVGSFTMELDRLIQQPYFGRFDKT